MDRDFLNRQKLNISNKLDQLQRQQNSNDLKNKLSILYNFTSLLLEPDKFTESQKEDLRKLALELNYTESSNFEEWFNENK